MNRMPPGSPDAASILDGVAEAYVRLDSQFRYTFVNRAAERLLGKGRDQLLGGVLWEVFSALLGTHFEEHYRRAMAERVTVTFEDYYEPRQRWYVITATPDSDAGIVVHFADVTERKRAEEAFRESEGRFRSLVEQSTGLIALTDVNGVIEYASPASERLFGVRPEQMTGCSFTQFLDQSSVQTAVAAFQDDLEKGRGTAGLELRMKRGDGSVFIGELSSSICIAPRQATLVTIRDVTELRRAEEALRESEDRYRNLFDQSGDMILLLDLRDGRPLILDANQAALRAYGYSREAMVGQSVALLEPDITPETIEERVRLMAAGKPIYLSPRRADGSLFEVESLARRVRIGGRDVVLAVERDITERKRAEQERVQLLLQLAQAQKMESVGRLAGGLAHDFNNLVMVITGYSAMALEEMQPEDPLLHSLTEILSASDRAAALVRQLLAFSRRQALHPEVLDLNATVGDMERMLRRLVREDIEIVARLDPAVAPVLADRHQIEQVIMNLAVNARDAMPGGGTLTLQTGERRLEGACEICHEQIRSGSYAELTVRDTGTGMDAHTLEHLFEPFFTTKGVGHGTGLGLSTVQGIVDQSGGHVGVESVLGKGSAFHVYLPVAQGQAEDSGPLPPVDAEGGTETILLVEDHQEVRRFIAAILGEYGYRVLEAGDPAEALLVSAAQQVDLLLTDVVMPRMSGVELARRARFTRPGLKVLFISGYSEATHEREWAGMEGEDFLQKPFVSKELAAKVREVLERR